MYPDRAPAPDAGNVTTVFRTASTRASHSGDLVTTPRGTCRHRPRPALRSQCAKEGRANRGHTVVAQKLTSRVGFAGARRVGSIAFDLAQRTQPVSVLVDDDAIVAARTALWQDYRMAVEHGAAAAYAGLTSGAYQPAPGERVAVVVCGANTDTTTLS